MSAELARPVAIARTTVVVADGDVGARESLRMILAPHHQVFTASCADALFDQLVRGRGHGLSAPKAPDPRRWTTAGVRCR